MNFLIAPTQLARFKYYYHAFWTAVANFASSRSGSNFKPLVYMDPDMKFTEFVLADTHIVFHPMIAGTGHFVDVGFDIDGNLVAVKIWADITKKSNLPLKLRV